MPSGAWCHPFAALDQRLALPEDTDEVAKKKKAIVRVSLAAMVTG
eukprot:gene34320-33199_t